MNKLKNKLKQILQFVNFDQLNLLSGHVAFFLVLSAIPIITLIGMIASLFSVSITRIVDFMENSFPTEVSELLIPFMEGSSIDVGLGIFMFVVFFTASNGPYAMIVAANTLYNGKPLTLMSGRIKSFFVTIMLVVLFIFMLLALAFGDDIVNFITSISFLSNYKDYIYTLYLLLKFPIAFLFIFSTIKLIYIMLPSKKIENKSVNIGALFTTIGWMIVTYIYSYYVSNIASYDIFYGSLSNIIIFMLWAYILSFILLLGISINYNHYHLEKSTTDNL